MSMLDSREAYEEYLNKCFMCSDEEFDAIYEANWSPDVEVSIQGQQKNYEDMYNNFKNLRSNIKSCQLKVIYLLRQGNIFADRHSAEGLMRDGTTTRVEAYCFGEVDDQGRVKKMEEAVIIGGDWEHPVKNSGGQ